jgi:hypothetical protein
MLIDLVILGTTIHKRTFHIYLLNHSQKECLETNTSQHAYLVQYLHMFYKITHKRTLRIYFIYLKYLAQKGSLLVCFHLPPPKFLLDKRLLLLASWFAFTYKTLSTIEIGTLSAHFISQKKE